MVDLDRSQTQRIDFGLFKCGSSVSFCCKSNACSIGVCESFFPPNIKIEVVKGTLLMISKLGVAEYCDLSQIEQKTFRPHFSFCVTTDADLSWSISLGLSSSLILINVSLFPLYWGLSSSTVPLIVVMF